MAGRGRPWEDDREVRELFRLREVDMAQKFQRRQRKDSKSRSLLWKQLAACLAQGFEERTGAECSRKYNKSLRLKWAQQLRNELHAVAPHPPPDAQLVVSDDTDDEASGGSGPAGKEEEEAEASGSGKKPCKIPDLNVPLSDQDQ